MNDFENLKEICRQACHERNACKSGYEALLATENIGQLLQVWRMNWQDIFSSKFADVMVKNIAKVYATSKAEFNAADVYVNEPSERGLVIISGAEEPIMVGGTARAYIFSPATVTAIDNAQVYCRTAGSTIILRGHSHGGIDNVETHVEVREFASANGSMDCETWQAAEVSITYGKLKDNGHRRIIASGGAIVYSNAIKGIELSGEAVQHPLEIKSEE